MVDRSVESLSALSAEVEVLCPYCGDLFSSVVDCSAGDAEYVEDCTACCQPILFQVSLNADGALAEVRVSRENE